NCNYRSIHINPSKPVLDLLTTQKAYPRLQGHYNTKICRGESFFSKFHPFKRAFSKPELWGDFSKIVKQKLWNFRQKLLARHPARLRIGFQKFGLTDAFSWSIRAHLSFWLIFWHPTWNVASLQDANFAAVYRGF